MPFGSFWIHKEEQEKEKLKSKKTGKEKKQEDSGQKTSPFFSQKEPESTAGPGAVGYRMSVLLLGRSQRAICNFLCSMNVNMNEMAGEQGLAFYTEDHQTMSRMIAAKKELDGIFYNRQGVREELEERDLKGPQKYDFRISLAGRQSRCLEISFICVAEADLREHPAAGQKSDALWILEEEPYLEQKRGMEGLSGLLGGQEPVLFLVSQFEHMERFRVLGQEITLSYGTKEKLTESAVDLWQYSADDKTRSCMMLPVQIYGGLEFTGWDDQRRIRLEVSKSGFYQRYIPVGCQMPLIYTVQACIGRQQAEFFHSDDGNELITRLIQIFHPYCESDALKAEQIGGTECEEGI